MGARQPCVACVFFSFSCMLPFSLILVKSLPQMKSVFTAGCRHIAEITLWATNRACPSLDHGACGDNEKNSAFY
jgi:hypothetical protein